MGKTVRDVLDELRGASQDEVEKGRKFEHLMLAFLRKDRQYSRLFDEVWLWADYPNRNGRPDTGIDLVARERATGGLVAIQCKFYAPDTVINKPAVDSFLATSSKSEFTGRLLITTSDHWGKNAKDALVNQTPPVSIMSVADLDESSIDWSKFSIESLSRLSPEPVKQPRPHQEAAINDCLVGLEQYDRGKLIMACGTGKTFTSLRLTERYLPDGGLVLFLVPSISLLSQAVKEWSINSEISMTSFAVCSDVSAGRRKNDEDLPVTDLAFPATTDVKSFMQKFQDSRENAGALKVVFSTYQSIAVVSEAQSMGLPSFDLIICDEAHRTAGVIASGEESTTFMKVHEDSFIASRKRLYMTATPKVFSDATAQKAEEQDALLADMNKEEIYGKEFHRIGFGEAVERGILTDYKVLVLAVDEQYVAEKYQRELADEDNQLNLEDTAKIVGCWNGLSKRALDPADFANDPQPMKRAVAFARSIAESKMVATMFQQVVDKELSQDSDDIGLRCEVQHVDGTFSSFDRNEKLDWLKQEPTEGSARILSNARCLTEGVDVPALDAIMFLKPRNSQIDVVQAVGRVMRKLDGKKYGYVILPIAVPAGIDPETALSDNKKYKVVWQVLQALRSHDERFDAMVNRIDLTGKSPQIEILGVGGQTPDESVNWSHTTLQFPNFDVWRDAILSKIVEKVGERRYWEKWAEDVSLIAQRHITRIDALLTQADSEISTLFAKFLKGLQDNLNPEVTRTEAVEMLAQHLITQPVFEALFGDGKFSEMNPVSRVMHEMSSALMRTNLEKEQEGLSDFYSSIRRRATGIVDPAARQAIVKELYEQFFRKAFPKMSERLGIVYTPIEIVDFMIHSVEEILNSSFNTSLASKNVHVLDPFTGTGTFIVRLIQSGLIGNEELLHKYRYELHANEIVLLAYYVAAVNIEVTFNSTVGGEYIPFDGIVLTDTFQLAEIGDEIDGGGVFKANNERAEKQKQLPIRVIIGNPPYSAGQSSASDMNQNVSYKSLDARIAETYVTSSTTTTRTAAYDSYVRAIRWASDLLGDEGVIAFVTNNSFIDSTSLDGLRKTILQEFQAVRVVNLRGNLRLGGDESKREGGNVFDVRVGIAIWFAYRSKRPNEAGELRYFEVSDFATKSQKLQLLRDARAISDLDLHEIKPNSVGDWINQRSKDYSSFLPVVSKKTGIASLESIFSFYSSGVSTHRDAWSWNYSENELKKNIQLLVENYAHALADRKKSGKSPGEIVRETSSKIPWEKNLISQLEKMSEVSVTPEEFHFGLYRPFTRKWLYSDKKLIWSAFSIRQIFNQGSPNLAIAVSGPGGSRFSVSVVDSIPDYDFLPKALYLPRWYTPKDQGLDGALFGGEQIDGISDWAKEYFCSHYKADVSSDDIFAYVYAALHSPGFVGEYASDLRKEFPRIPLWDDFDQVSAAGKELLTLHSNFDSNSLFPLTIDGGPVPDALEALSLKFKRNGSKTDQTKVLLNEKFEVSGFPSEVFDYRVGAKNPLEWVVSSAQPARDSKFGVLQDPYKRGAESGKNRELLDLAARVCTLAVESTKIIGRLKH